jgi:tRNA-2-methylthio-N6-dimethylallyladenosine synthase
MNEYDSDYLAQSLISAGGHKATSEREADLIIINTCSVRAKPEQKALSQIGRAISLKKRRPDLIVGAVGCVAQEKGQELLDRFQSLDFVLGPRELGRILPVLEGIEKRRQRVSALKLEGGCRQGVVTPGYFKGKISGYVSIMEGCNNYCAYCIVPYVRGRESSRAPHEILDEIEALAEQGVRDITLLGQNVNSYSYNEAHGQVRLRDLLERLDKVSNIWRIRFTTSHPRDLTEDLVEGFSQIGKLCPHIHLPFQAGSDKILRAMGRGYSRDYYIGKVMDLRRVRPDIAITADVMVGFPGETEEDFEQTLDLIKRIGFDGLFSFIYSDRKGTAAESLRDKVPYEIKAGRLKRLQALQKGITLKKNRDFEGKTVEVLVEGEAKRDGQLTGRSQHNRIVNFEGDISMIGKLVHVKITHGLMNSLKGELHE